MKKKIKLSDCCNYQYIRKKLSEKGLFKKVCDVTTGITHKVPTKIMIEEVLVQENLKNYPIW